LQRRREHLLHALGGFGVTGEVPELQVDVPEERKELRFRLEQLPEFVGALLHP
jgi:hypothetical protein